MSPNGTRRSFVLWRLVPQIRTLLRNGQQARGGGSPMSRLRHSDLNLLRNQKGIVDVNPKIPNRALDLGVAQQELDRPEIACPSVDH
jgi:hypothetical protein